MFPLHQICPAVTEDQFPSFLTDPMHWTEVHVRHWIQWAVKEFGLANVIISNFAMDGRHLCGLTHPEFVRYIPHDPGDIFWTHLELLRKCKFVGEWLLCFTG